MRQPGRAAAATASSGGDEPPAAGSRAARPAAEPFPFAGPARGPAAVEQQPPGGQAAQGRGDAADSRREGGTHSGTEHRGSAGRRRGQVVIPVEPDRLGAAGRRDRLDPDRCGAVEAVGAGPGGRGLDLFIGRRDVGQRRLGCVRLDDRDRRVPFQSLLSCQRRLFPVDIRAGRRGDRDRGQTQPDGQQRQHRLDAIPAPGQRAAAGAQQP
ncbi:hypothetical protein FNH06_00190 [Amycolatopsis acidiphila]|uniref:Uncharacterized protein n=1 Tax=Amycolatopsis acidiphila TaxID=715473 RepID=A0A558ANR2_9PSEU|nr:hypothetical protein FNH06_00190 [Amycolatopsis acidiphila]